jgi:hypothetical protein
VTDPISDLFAYLNPAAEPEPLDDGPDPRDEHDAWHPWWIEGCDGCVDRAAELEQARDVTTRVDSDAS